jgi:hypothetical protein
MLIQIIHTTGKVLKNASSSGYMLLVTLVLVPVMVVAQEANPTVDARLTSGRLASICILLVGIVSVVIGYRSRKQAISHSPTDKNSKRAMVSLVLGLVCLFSSVFHLANTTDVGTGGGKAGSIVAVLVGSIGVLLASVTLYRTRTNKWN